MQTPWVKFDDRLPDSSDFDEIGRIWICLMGDGAVRLASKDELNGEGRFSHWRKTGITVPAPPPRDLFSEKFAVRVASLDEYQQAEQLLFQRGCGYASGAPGKLSQVSAELQVCPLAITVSPSGRMGIVSPEDSAWLDGMTCMKCLFSEIHLLFADLAVQRDKR